MCNLQLNDRLCSVGIDGRIVHNPLSSDTIYCCVVVYCIESNTVVSNHVTSDHVPSFSCLDV